MASSASTHLERAIAVAVFAPIGFGAQLADNFPGTVTKARQQLEFARFVGKMAVDQGAIELRRRLAPPVTRSDPDRSRAPEPPEANNETAEEGSGKLDLGLAELALPDYDQLPASQIVSKLSGLTLNELNALEVYETAHRQRRTVLGRIRQLKEV